MLRVDRVICAALIAFSAASGGEPISVFVTRGSAYDRGFQHGEAFKDRVRKDFAARGGWGWSVPAHHREPAVLNHFLLRVRALEHGAELIEEMQGIAAGADVPFVDILGLNLTFDLGDRTACSMALLPDGPDGPILLNTLDDFTGGRGYPMFMQLAYPTNGQAMIFLCNVGTVWAHQGLSDAGLAIGSTSGGIGPPRGGANYDGVYYALLARYALQFFTTAEQTIQLFADNRQISKGINVAVLDRAGRGAAIEYAAFAVGVRHIEMNNPLYVTNFFQTDKFPPYPESCEALDYMKNARGRYTRLAALLEGQPHLDLSLAMRVIENRDGDDMSQICQENRLMYTWCANVFECREGVAHVYPTTPGKSPPKGVRFDPAHKPSSGQPAPDDPAVRAILDVPPKTIQLRHVKHYGVTLSAVEPDGMRFGFKTADGVDRRAELGAATIQIYAPASLSEIPGDSRASLWGMTAPDRSSFRASRIVTYRPPHPWPGEGRCVGSEASGALHRRGDDLQLTYDVKQPPVKILLADDLQAYVAYKASPAYLRPGQKADVFGSVLFDDDTVHVTYLLIYVDAAEAARLKSGGR